MSEIRTIEGQLHVEQLSCEQLAQQFGTPTYIYSRSAIENAWQRYEQALQGFKHRMFYAVKANSNLAVLQVLAARGAGFDIVSQGELERVLKAGGLAENIVFSGVGKKHAEMARALEVGIRCFNVESPSELTRLNEVAAAHGVVAPVSLRVNPDVDAKTHPYISTGLKHNKFGIAWELAPEVYQTAADSTHLNVCGVDAHIGSQLSDISPYEAAMTRLLSMVDQLADRGIVLDHVDVGGGFGVRYQPDESDMDAQQWAASMQRLLAGRDIELWIEPGRSIVANAGILLTQVEFLKQTPDHNFAIVDAAMNDLIRPSLYQAWQDIVPTQQRDCPEVEYDVVGPVCESTDFLGKQRHLKISEGDHLAVLGAGAYGFGMASNYNSRPRVAEVLVDGDKAHLARRRETIEELYAAEQLLEAL